jgi:ribosomal protein L4
MFKRNLSDSVPLQNSMIKLPVYNLAGKEVSSVELDERVFAVDWECCHNKIRMQLIAQTNSS